MTITSRYIFIVSMDVEPDHEALFNEVYDTEHVPYLMEVPGVLSCTRAKAEPFSVSIGGETKEMPAASPSYTAIYEIESPDVLTTPAWEQAVERGRWPSVRPHTHNRRHGIYKVS